MKSFILLLCYFPAANVNAQTWYLPTGLRWARGLPAKPPMAPCSAAR